MNTDDYLEDEDLPPAFWDELDSDTQDALIEWYNVREDDFEFDDYERLYNLHEDGKFTHYNCGYCEEKVYYGEPDNWADFQGVDEKQGFGELCEDCYSLYRRLGQLAGEYKYYDF